MPKNPMQDLRQLQFKRQQAAEQIIAAARPLVAILKDHKLDHSASELAAAIFELDAINGEVHNLITSDPTAFINLLIESMEKGGPR